MSNDVPTSEPSVIGARARDHRGRWCRLRPRVGPGEEAPAVEKGEVDWSFTLPALGCVGIFLAAGCGAGAMAYAALTTITKNAPVWIPLSIAAAGAGAYVAWALWRRRRNRVALLAESHIRLWLVKGRCPSCGYALAELAPSPEDGCTVCPECGSAWRRGGSASED